MAIHQHQTPVTLIQTWSVRLALLAMAVAMHAGSDASRADCTTNCNSPQCACSENCNPDPECDQQCLQYACELNNWCKGPPASCSFGDCTYGPKPTILLDVIGDLYLCWRTEVKVKVSRPVPEGQIISVYLSITSMGGEATLLIQPDNYGAYWVNIGEGETEASFFVRGNTSGNIRIEAEVTSCADPDIKGQKVVEVKKQTLQIHNLPSELKECSLAEDIYVTISPSVPPDTDSTQRTIRITNEPQCGSSSCPSLRLDAPNAHPDPFCGDAPATLIIGSGQSQTSMFNILGWRQGGECDPSECADPPLPPLPPCGAGSCLASDVTELQAKLICTGEVLTEEQVTIPRALAFRINDVLAPRVIYVPWDKHQPTTDPPEEPYFIEGNFVVTGEGSGEWRAHYGPMSPWTPVGDSILLWEGTGEEEPYEWKVIDPDDWNGPLSLDMDVPIRIQGLHYTPSWLHFYYRPEWCSTQICQERLGYMVVRVVDVDLSATHCTGSPHCGMDCSMSHEEKQDPGVVICVNSKPEENGIDPANSQLKNVTLNIQGISHYDKDPNWFYVGVTGRWTLHLDEADGLEGPAGVVKVWRNVGVNDWEEVTFGQPSDEIELSPTTMPVQLKIEGISPSIQSKDITLRAEFTPSDLDQDPAPLLEDRLALTVVQLRNMTVDHFPMPIDGKTTIQAEVEILPADRTVVWGPEDLGLGAKINPATGEITAGTREGMVYVVAADAECPECILVGELPAECGGCTDCQPGEERRFKIGSLDVQIGLGRASDGGDAGALWIYADFPRQPEDNWTGYEIPGGQPLELLGTPAGLRYPVRAEGVTVIRDEENAIRQVITPLVIADVDPKPQESHEYDIRFYTRTGQEAFAGHGGLEPDGDPYVTWTIQYQGQGQIRIAKTVGVSPTREWVYQYAEQRNQFSDAIESNTWTMTTYDGNQQLLQTEIVETDYDTNTWWLIEEVRTVIEDQVEVSKEERSYTWPNRHADEVIDFYHKGLPYEHTIDPDGASLTTQYQHYTSGDNVDRLKSIENPDGSWVYYQYDAFGRISVEMSSWLDVPLTGNEPNAAVVRARHYTYDGDDPLESPIMIEEYIENVKVARTHYHEETDTFGGKVEIVEECQDVGASYGDPGNLRRVTTHHAPTEDPVRADKIARIQHPDDQVTEYDYERGHYDYQTGGFTPDTQGSAVRTTVTHRVDDSSQILDIPGKSTQQMKVVDGIGNTVFEGLAAYDGSTYQLVSWAMHAYDGHGQRYRTDHHNGTYIETHWSCCEKVWETDIYGIKTWFDFDPMGRLISRTKEGVDASGDYAAQASITRSTERDVLQDGIRITETTSGGALELERVTQYDKVNRVSETTDESGLTTTFDYDVVTGSGRVVTRTLFEGTPSEVTEVTEYYRDGRIKSVTGTAVVDRFYTYGVNIDGTQWTTVHTGSPTSDNRVTTTTDGLGRTIKEERPGFGWDSGDPGEGLVVTTHEYYTTNGDGASKGRLFRVSTTGQAPTVYEYDELGNIVRTGLDVDNNGLDVASSDRIQDTETFYEKDGAIWWQVTESWTYPVDGSGVESERTAQWRQLTGFWGDLIENVFSVDVHGNETSTVVYLDRAEREVMQLTFLFPSGMTADQTITRNGLLQFHQSNTGVTTTFGYDDLGRREEVTDAKTGTTTTAYYTEGQGKIGRVKSVTDANDRTTTYDYESDTGRQKSITNPDGKVQYFSYSPRGELERVWGHTPYPVEYGYDDYGRRETMTTFRSGTSWDQSTWPGGSGDTTTWHYEEATGLLEEKEYADGKKTTYTYTVDGKIATRTWAREVISQALVTTYTYDPDTGKMTKVEYNDATPTVEFEYDRLGRHASIQDAVGTRTFSYDPETLVLKTEDIDDSGGGLYSRLITREYTEWGLWTAGGRPAGFQIGTSSDPDEDYEVTYGYDEIGRFERVGGPGLPAGGVVYVYPLNESSFLAETDMVRAIEYQDAGQNVLASTTFSYEFDEQGKHRPVRTLVDNQRDHSTAPLVSKYTYTYDNLGRRKDVVQEGAAFASDRLFKWDYNLRSELVTADRHDGITDPASASEGNRFTQNGKFVYKYDPIGNREEYERDTDPKQYYCANAVNQYEKTSTADDCPDPTSPEEEFDYDFDGNLIEDGQFKYAWDAENRLIRVEPAGAPVNQDKKVEFKYDYMSRRVEKSVYEHNGSTWGDPIEVLRFVYDQWNVVMVLDGRPNQDNATLRKYTWGLDLSGQNGNPTAAGIHGAGGIGGLLAVEETATSGEPSYWFFYDANGNVGQVIKDDTDYPLAAQYEYDPYGNLINIPTGYGAENPFRFSTKWFDAETGLCYYGYRYLIPRLGRWTNRDSIEEAGGRNLYVSMSNQPITKLDPLGLHVCDDQGCEPTAPSIDCNWIGLAECVLTDVDDLMLVAGACAPAFKVCAAIRHPYVCIPAAACAVRLGVPVGACVANNCTVNPGDPDPPLCTPYIGCRLKKIEHRCTCVYDCADTRRGRIRRIPGQHVWNENYPHHPLGVRLDHCHCVRAFRFQRGRGGSPPDYAGCDGARGGTDVATSGCSTRSWITQAGKTEDVTDHFSW